MTHPIGKNTSTDIAIIGMSCRYPGNVNTPEEFFEFLLAGGDGICDVPKDRWDNDAYYDADVTKANKMYVNRGGFLKNIDYFDPQFFGLSPKEAPHIDPQHRWLLELTFEALENAGIKASELKGSNTAVYIGQFMHDYEQVQLDSLAHSMMSNHSATGPSMTLTANRISYCFDFTGPSVTLDTACSSSLVALDLACKALLGGDSKVAIAGGVNILLRPELTMSICKASMLSPDCQCKSFDAAANGYVRSEGAGLVVVKTLEDALADGDNILAVIKSCGTNQDGHTSGITVPNGISQQQLLLRNLKKAGMTGADIQYAEAHGTGTAVGDPIEVNAIGKILGARDTSEEKCFIGSVKSNIGHTEAAAGMAGLIKTVMAMRTGKIPGNIHFNNINPAINLHELNISIAHQNTDWPATFGKTRKAVVNSFGFGGTNANVILEEAPQQNTLHEIVNPLINSGNYLLTLSAKTAESLKQQAETYISYFKNSAAGNSLADVCQLAATKRDHFKHRLVVVASDLASAQQELQHFLDGKPSAGYVHAGAHKNHHAPVAFVFSGMGTTWPKMAQDLYDAEPVFKNTMDRCSAALQVYTGWSLVERIYASDDAAEIHETHIAQPAIFSVQVALAALYESWGIKPACIVGHSAGEVAAAHIGGVLDFNDAIKVIYHRSRLQHTTEGMGRMLAVGLPQQEVNALLQGLDNKISIAAINSDDAITLSGDAQALEELAEQLDAQGVFARFLKVGVPYHSPVMDILKEPLITALRDIKVMTPHVALYSTVSGSLTEKNTWNAEYWADNVREPVFFKAAIDNIAASGITTFIEIAPHAALASSIEKNTRHLSDVVVVPTIKREQNNCINTLAALATLHVHGLDIDWNAIYPTANNAVTLPNYTWEHKSYWHEHEEVKNARINNTQARGAFSKSTHPLLGGKLASATYVWQNPLDWNELAYIADHKVDNEIVYPGAAYVEMALKIARELNEEDQAITLENVHFNRAFFIDKDKDKTIESSYDIATGAYKIAAVDDNNQKWFTFSEGYITHNQSIPAQVDIGAIRAQLTDEMDKASFYAHCHHIGLHYLDSFQTVKHAWYRGDDALVSVQVTDALVNNTDNYLLHPTLLDGAFQSLFATVQKTYLPVKIAALHYYKKPEGECYAHLVTQYKTHTHIRGDLRIYDQLGNILVEMIDIEVRATQADANNLQALSKLTYQYQWQLQPGAEQTAGKASAKHWLIFTDEQGVGDALTQALQPNAKSITGVTKKEWLAAQGNFTSIAALAAKCDGIIYLWGLDSHIPAGMDVDVVEACRDTTITPLQLVQALNQINWHHAVDLYFVTHAAHQWQHATAMNPAQAALWGFARVLSSEHLEYNVGLIDIDSPLSASTLNQLAAELTRSEHEQEVALRNGQRYVHRLEKLSAEALAKNKIHTRESTANDNVALRIDTTRQAASLAVVVDDSPIAPAADEICIHVEKVALSSSALSMDKSVELNNHHAFNSADIYEYAGTVISVGSHVSSFVSGDKVISLSNESPAATLNIKAWHSVKVTGENPFAALAQLRDLISAHYALTQLAQLQALDSVLVQDADQPAGLAAAFIARQLGARVVAVVANESSLETLASLSLEKIYVSNSAEYRHDLLQANTHMTFAAILNFAHNPQIHHLVKLLKECGQYIDFSSTPSVVNPQLLHALSDKAASHHQYHFYKNFTHNSQAISHSVGEVTRFIHENSIVELALPEFALQQVAEAAEHLQKSSATEKILIHFSGTPTTALILQKETIVDATKSYLITGGLGGLGLEIMKWLATQGAREILLVGRSKPSAHAQTLIDAVVATGVTVNVLQADISSTSDTTNLFRVIAENCAPLGGIIHSAGVLEDATINQQNEEKYVKVLRPKLQGAWNLHQHTQDMALDFFVCFSSIAAVIGWAGQSNYASANSFMDGLCHYRSAQGKHALSINWGPWAEAGMAANLTNADIQRMNKAGMAALIPTQGLDAMATLIQTQLPQAGVFDLNWANLLKAIPDLKRATVFELLMEKTESSTEDDFIVRFQAADTTTKLSLLTIKTRQIVAEVLGIDLVDNIDPSVNIFEYGLNSLMAMDLKNRLQASIQVQLPTTLALKFPTINGMVGHIISERLQTAQQNDISVVRNTQKVKVSI